MVTAAAAEARSVWPTVLACGYLAVVPSRSFLAHSAYDEQRVIAVMLAVVLSAGTIMSRTRREAAAAVVGTLGRWRWVLLAISLAGVASALAATDPATAWLDLSLVAGAIGIGLAVATDCRRAPQVVMGVVLTSAVIGLAYYAADLLTLPDLSGRARGLWYREDAGGFANPRYLNQWQVALVPLATVWLRSVLLTRWVKAVVALVLAVTWWELLLLEGRGAAVALALAVGAVALFHGRSGRVFALDLLWTASLGAVAAVLSRPSLGLPGRIVSGDPLSGSGRVDEWGRLLGVVADHPLLGVGPGHLAHVEYFGTTNALAHPHSALMQFAAEWGLPAAMALIAVLTAAALTMRRTEVLSVPPAVGLTKGAVAAALVTSAAALSALSMVSGVVVTAVGLVSLATIAGGVLGHASTRAAGRDGKRWPINALLVAVLLLQLPALVEVVSESPKDQQMASQLLQGVNQPRFWRQGLRGLELEAGGPPVLMPRCC